MIAEMLTLGSYRVETADCAEAALERLRSEPFDAVLSDIRMPGMSGIELRDRLMREQPALARRFAFITGELANLPARSGPASGETPCLEKPVTPRGVLELVRSLLAER